MDWLPLAAPHTHQVSPPILPVVASPGVSPTTRAEGPWEQVPPPTQSVMAKRHGEAARDNGCRTKGHLFFCHLLDTFLPPTDLTLRQSVSYWEETDTRLEHRLWNQFKFSHWNILLTYDEEYDLQHIYTCISCKTCTFQDMYATLLFSHRMNKTCMLHYKCMLHFYSLQEIGMITLSHHLSSHITFLPYGHVSLNLAPFRLLQSLKPCIDM